MKWMLSKYWAWHIENNYPLLERIENEIYIDQSTITNSCKSCYRKTRGRGHIHGAVTDTQQEAGSLQEQVPSIDYMMSYSHYPKVLLNLGSGKT
jgi:hypothetical protein